MLKETPVSHETRWEQLWLPLWPLASDDLREGIYRCSRSRALGLRYIEANPSAMSNLLVVDVDHEDALMRAIECRHNWLPNAVVENPKNGHAHAVWALSEPVTRTEYARRKPLALATAVTEGLRRSCDGDKGYSGLLTKNPEHQTWHANWLTDHLYTLNELTSHLANAGFMPAPSWRKTRRKTPIGLGRNCAIFESARTWAYPVARQIRQRNEWATPQDSHDLLTAITTQVSDLNNSYTEPLPTSEAQGIIRSIHRWITTKSDLWNQHSAVTQATFITIQSSRGKLSGQARRTARDRKLVLLDG